MNKHIEILIIGAGPSGMVAAGFLEKNGIKPLVVEKQRFPRFSIGESLIPRCMDNLEEAGLLEVLMPQGYQKKYGARFIRDKEISEFDFSKKFGDGWDWTWQVPRADFDLSLTQEIQRRGIDIRFETEVRSVNRKSDFWMVELSSSSGENYIIEANFIIDASGNGRVLARQFDLEAAPKIYEHSSIFTHIDETERPEGKEGELISFEIIDKSSWFWYIPFSNGKSSLGFVGPDTWVNSQKSGNSEIFQRLLKETNFYNGRFDSYRHIFEPIQFRNISRNVTSTYGEGFVLTGNSAEFLDPVFSSGVAFATESGLLAAKLLVRELQGINVNWQTDYSDHINQGVNVFSTYVKEWYSGRLQDIFFYPDQSETIKKQICAVLAGYVWDKTNPFVRNHKRILKNLHQLIQPQKN